MALVTDKPAGTPSGNDLDNVDLGETPAAYLTFGSSPSAMDEPPSVGETRRYVVEVRCTAEHGPIERKDGEMRYTRSLAILRCWREGATPPPINEDQGALFDHDGNPADDPDHVVDAEVVEDGEDASADET